MWNLGYAFEYLDCLLNTLILLCMNIPVFFGCKFDSFFHPLTAHGINEISAVQELLSREADLNRIIPNVTVKWKFENKAEAYVCLLLLCFCLYLPK